MTLDRLGEALDFKGLLRGLELGRATFWVALGLGLWSLLRASALAPAASAAEGASVGPARRRPNAALMVRVLVVCNVVFALQTFGDAATLWPRLVGASPVLPEGVAFAEHARQGAFSLLAAALLAALIILLALRDDRPAAAHRATRVLVLLWVAQTLVLLLSAASRLDLYVDAYGLTRLRLAAFVWMAVIAAGLVLTIVRVLRNQPNAWLIRTSLMAALTALYVYGASDTDRFIAERNVDRALAGQDLDGIYLCSLGHEALPAMHRYLAVDPQAYPRTCVARQRRRLARRQADWRSWTWRGHRILTDPVVRSPLPSPLG